MVVRSGPVADDLGVSNLLTTWPAGHAPRDQLQGADGSKAVPGNRAMGYNRLSRVVILAMPAALRCSFRTAAQRFRLLRTSGRRGGRIPDSAARRPAAGRGFEWPTLMRTVTRPRMAAHRSTPIITARGRVEDQSSSRLRNGR